MAWDHGVHNKDACDSLISGNKYHDWIVTTAFYSSIHFIDTKLFPYNYNGRTIRSINEASNIFGKSKHSTREKLVYEVMQPISNEFKYLLTSCSTARYIRYKVNPESSALCRKYLDKIIAYCDTL